MSLNNYENNRLVVTTTTNDEISRGALGNYGRRIKFGYNPDIDTAAVEDLNYFGDLTYLTSASTFTITSDSANDAAAGTGAREVYINYLDANYEEQIGMVIPTGLSGAASTFSGLRVLSAWCGECGTGGTNAGNIAITATTGGTTQGYIPLGRGQTEQIAYTVPAGYTAFFIHGSFSVSETTGGALKETDAFIEADIRLYNEDSTNNYECWRTLFQIMLNNRGTGYADIPQPLTNPIPEKTDVRIRSGVGANDTRVTARLFIKLVKNDSGTNKIP